MKLLVMRHGEAELNARSDSDRSLTSFGRAQVLVVMLESAGQAVPDNKRIFELNPDHPLVQKLNDESDGDRFNDLARVLYDQAQLAEGSQLDEPATYVARLNKLLLELSK